MQQPPDRRATLKLGGLAFAASSLPWWAACARSTDEPQPQHPLAPPPTKSGPWRTPLERALESAERGGKPLLVLLDRDASGEWFGSMFAAMLRLASDDEVALLAVCEVVVASSAQVEALLAPGVRVLGSGLVERAERELRWTELHWDMSNYGWTDGERLARAVRSNFDALGELLVSGEALARRAKQARAALPPAVCQRVDAALTNNEKLAPEDLQVAAALVLAHPKWPQRVAALAQAVRGGLASRPPLGSRWASDRGCGVESVEYLPTDDAGVRMDIAAILDGAPRPPRDERGRPVATSYVPPLGVLCGMGYAGPDGERFLLAYVDEP